MESVVYLSLSSSDYINRTMFWFGRWSAAKKPTTFLQPQRLLQGHETISAICFKTSPWTEMDVAWLRKMSSLWLWGWWLQMYDTSMGGGVTRGSQVTVSFHESPLSWKETVLHFWEDFDLHWHLEQNRVTFSGECMWDVGVSDGLDGI